MSRNAPHQFIPTDPAEIIAWMTAKYEEITKVTVQPGSPEQLFIRWAAAVIIQERVLTNYAANQNLPSRAEGENLDALAEIFYTRERPKAKPSACKMRFHISEPQKFAVLVPAGTRITDASQTLVWATLADVYVNAGESWADTRAECQTAGTIGNGYVKGQINTIVDVFPYYASCENVTETDGGSNEATDKEFYELLRLSMDGYSCAGARGGYVYFAKKVSTEIADVIAASPTPGVVKLYVLMNDGTPATEEMKAQVLEACSADDVRPLTDLVSVEDPETVDYRIRFTYYTEKDSEIGGAELEAAVRKKVDQYAAWQCAKLGRDINPSRLVSMLMETGIKRVDLVEPVFRRLEDGKKATALQQVQRKEANGPDVERTPQLARLAEQPEIISGGYEDE